MTDSHAPVPYDFDEAVPTPTPGRASPRSRGVALCLNVLLGWCGGHRFYVGKVRSGVFQLLTLGGLGVWWLYDFILIVAGEFPDAGGRRLRHWSPDEATGFGPREGGQLAQVVRDLDLLRAQVSELNERMDFAERVLTQQRERGRLAP